MKFILGAAIVVGLAVAVAWTFEHVDLILLLAIGVSLIVVLCVVGVAALLFRVAKDSLR